MRSAHLYSETMMAERRCLRRSLSTTFWQCAFLVIAALQLVHGFVPVRSPSFRLNERRVLDLPRLQRADFQFSLATTAGGSSHHHQSTGDSTETSQQERLKWNKVLVPNSMETEHLHDRMTMADKVSLVSITAFGILAFAWLIRASGPGAWRYYLAGGICAATSHSIPVPVDVVKTRKQVDPKLYKLNFVDATRHIVKHEGLNALLAGLGPTIWGYMLEGAIKFGVYEMLKPIVKGMLLTLSTTAPALASLNSRLFGYTLCATASGVAASLMLCPMEALRIRLVAEPDFAPKGWIQGGFKMLKYEGVGALWKGMIPMLWKQVPYTATKNVSFDFITTYAYATARAGGFHMGPTTKFTVPLLSAALASILSCVSSQPGDMLLSLVNAHEGDRRRTRDFVRDILRSDRGVRGLFIGIKTRLLHVGIIVTLQLLIYDFVKRLCGIAATGSV